MKQNLSQLIAAARDALSKDQLVVLPTDTVYGVGADPFSSRAVTRLLQVKGRTESMPPPVLVHDVDVALGLVNGRDAQGNDLTEALKRLAGAFWPGPLTIVLPTEAPWGWGKTDSAKKLLSSAKTVALRVPAQEETLLLLDKSGPMAVTSANLTGRPPATTIEQAREYFADNVAVYIDAGPSTLQVASTIIDCSERPFKLLRSGGIDWGDIEEVLN